jgi:Tol biopolymer transport system component
MAVFSKFFGISLVVAAALASSLLMLFAAMNPAEAAFPGNNGAIAFTSLRSGDNSNQIYRMNNGGSGQTRLTSFGTNYQPAWSADGAKIVFTNRSSDGGDYEVYRMNGDGSGTTNLTNDPTVDLSPAWAPNNHKVFFSRQVGGDQDIYAITLNADGTPFQLTQIVNMVGNDTQVAVSPNGKKIVWVNDFSGKNEIFEMNAVPQSSTNSPVQLTNSTQGNNIQPDWSPDGTKIVFASNRFRRASNPDGGYEIYTMHPSGSIIDLLTVSNRADNSDPVFSPNSAKVAFVSTRDGNAEIYKMDSDGSNQANLTHNPAPDTRPSWQPVP